MSTSPPPNRRLEVKAQDLAQARNLHHHSQYTECAALLLTAERGAEDATALLKAALDNIRRHPRTALGIDDEASASDAKRAYRKLALKLHPDKTNGATSELFAALTEAHKAVSGEKRRAKAPKPPSRKSKPKPPKPPAPPEPPAQTRVDLDENQDQDSTWEKRYWALAAFKLKKGHCFPDGVLGDWCAAQRRAREEGKLSADRRQRLEQLGFNVDDDNWRARPVNNDDAGCTGASDGWSWSRSRASTSNEARTERTTREFTLFGYVVARFETTSAYGQPASES